MICCGQAVQAACCTAPVASCANKLGQAGNSVARATRVAQVVRNAARLAYHQAKAQGLESEASLSVSHALIQDDEHFEGDCREVTLLSSEGSPLIKYKICVECKTIICTDGHLKPAPEACKAASELLGTMHNELAEKALGELLPRLPEHLECENCRLPAPKINVRELLPRVGPGWKRAEKPTEG